MFSFARLGVCKAKMGYGSGLPGFEQDINRMSQNVKESKCGHSVATVWASSESLARLQGLLEPAGTCAKARRYQVGARNGARAPDELFQQIRTKPQPRDDGR